MFEAGVLVPTNSLYLCPVWPMKKVDGWWMLTIDYQGLKKVVPPITFVVSDMVSALQNIQARGDGYSEISLADAFVLITTSE